MRTDNYEKLSRKYIEDNKLNIFLQHIGLKYYGDATVTEIRPNDTVILTLEDGKSIETLVDSTRIYTGGCQRLNDLHVGDVVTVSIDSWDGLIFRSLGEKSAYRCNDLALKTMLEWRELAYNRYY